MSRGDAALCEFGVKAAYHDEHATVLDIPRIMFANGTLACLHTHGADPIGELEQYEDSHRLCYACSPEGIIVAFAEQLS
ncbi:hypothetical protein ABZW96_35490 [Nocardia sp. NPDC004168]|uniref:hypothetical protein n=1 Tax=Nocardia sp. NPDC004168 TaxID=3154452 RepID=UPI0033AFE4CF